MTQPKKPFLVILAMLMALTFAGCTSGGGNDASQTKQESTEGESTGEKETSAKSTVVRFSGVSAETFNQHTSENAETSLLMEYIYGNLLELIYDEATDNVKFIPNHAVDLPETSDNKTWTFKLKEGLKWSDGTPITAHDYEYSYQMLLDPKLVNRNAFMLFDNIPVVSANSYFKGEAKWEVVGIKAKDDLTLEIVLETAMPEIDVFLVFAGGGPTSPIHKQLYEAGMNADRTATTYGTTREQVPSSGTYRLTDWVRDQYRIFEKNPDAPLKDVYTPDRIESRVVLEQSTRMQLWEKGEIEYVTISGEQFDKYGDDPRVVYTEARGVWGYYINSDSKKNPILANNDMRKALFYGIDREKIVKGIFKTYKAAPYYISTLNMVGDYKEGQRYRETDEAKAIVPDGAGYDPELAKEYFDKAYAANGNKKITIEITYFDGSENMKRTAEMTEELYENLFGQDRLDIKLRAMPASAAYDTYRDGDFDLGIGSITQNAFNPWSSMKAWRTDFPNRSHRFSSPEFDELQKRTTIGDLLLKPQERLEALAEMEKMLLDFVPQVPVFQNNNAVLFQDRIELKAKGTYFPSVEFAPLQSIIHD
ncbi:peptide ABC transporter substrate-binding protein [Paenibacillus thiaminolyticus]|uniref:peptide ABC transporter substrate-binding protein n=1 Tax=Paenibacillus thiaminolyticus TaxID=49283 RepID=UPI002330374C|nr:peptide ABC transporter substrate-binding protein [Paenibacillus thiaminolyticus]WCF06796.1 peptide ABC transporter substrate-binding protein [Paenibacillus thiaminolyticus]